MGFLQGLLNNLSAWQPIGSPVLPNPRLTMYWSLAHTLFMGHVAKEEERRGLLLASRTLGIQIPHGKASIPLQTLL